MKTKTMTALSLLLLVCATSLAAPPRYRRDINGNISIYQNNLKINTFRRSPSGYRQYDRHNRYQKTYYGYYNETVNGSYYW